MALVALRAVLDPGPARECGGTWSSPVTQSGRVGQFAPVAVHGSGGYQSEECAASLCECNKRRKTYNLLLAVSYAKHKKVSEIGIF